MVKTKIDSRRIGIFGASGSGKTTKALKLVENCRRLIVFDVLDDFTGKFIRTTDLSKLKAFVIKNYVRGFRIAYIPPAGSEPRALSELSLFLRDLQRGYKFNKHNAKVTLFVDELNVAFPLGYSRQKPDNGFCFLNNQGRHYGINVSGCSQRMSLVDMPFRANLSDLFVFRVADYNDIKAATAILGTPYRDTIQNLPNYKYIYKNERGVKIIT